MSQPTTTTHTVQRVVFTTSRHWDDVVKDLRAKLGRSEGSLFLWMPEGNDATSVADSIRSRVGPSGLLMFVEVPLSRTFHHFVPQGTFCPKVTQFIIGDPMTASRIYRETPTIGLLAPPRISVVELPQNKGTEIVYDLPSSIIGGESEEARVIAESVDQRFEKLSLSLL